MEISELRIHLAAIDDKIADLDSQITGASFAALRNPDTGDAAVAALQKQIAVQRAKRDALAHELDAAQRHACDPNTAAEAAERQRHIEAAREHAKRVVAVAGKVDLAVAAFPALLCELGDAEAATRNSLRAADVNVSDTVSGRQGIMSAGLFRMKASLDGRDRFVNSRPQDIADLARVAWGSLIDGEWPDAD